MAYFEDMFGNLHYHEPAGTEEQWLPADPETGFIDPELAQVKAAAVTESFLAKLAETQRVTLKTGEVIGGAEMADIQYGPWSGPAEPSREDIIRTGLAGLEGGGLASMIPAVIGGGVPGILAGIGAAVPALAGIAGVAGAGYGLFQALGGGEGEGLFGLDILGGGNGRQSVNGIPLGGPGLAEPAARTVIKEWHVSYDWGRLQYYLVQMPGGGRRIALYNTRTKRWKSWPWRKPHLAVIGKNMPSHKQLTRLKRNMVRHRADAQTIMKLTGGMPGKNHHGQHRQRQHRHH